MRWGLSGLAALFAATAHAFGLPAALPPAPTPERGGKARTRNAPGHGRKYGHGWGAPNKYGRPHWGQKLNGVI